MSPIPSSVRRTLRICLLAAGLTVTATAVAEETDIVTLRHMLDSAQTTAAWEYAQKLADTHLGEPEFDYLYGLAALEAGAPQHAIFAFERVLLAQPEHLRARLELARAHYISGNDRAARAAFEQVLASDPPEGVRVTINQFMSAIERREAASRTRLSGYADVRVGYDSNVASATSDEQIQVPALGVVTLNESGRAASDRFLEKNAGVQILHPFSKRYALQAEFNFKDRENFSTDDGDIRVAAASAGPVFALGSGRLRVPLQVQSLYIDNDSYRRIGAVGLEWMRNIDARNAVMINGEYGSLRYPGQATRNVHLALVGGVWTHRLPEQRMEFNTGLFYGDESNQDSAAAYNAKQYYGVRVAGHWLPHTRHMLYAMLTAQMTEHDAADPVFNVVREEEYAEVRLGWRYSLAKDWSLRAELSAARNDANIALYEFDREQVYLGLRYQFE